MQDTYPIAEIFTSPQGEGCWAGQLQTFVRFAGCTVGKPFPKACYEHGSLPIYVEQCTTYDQRHFECDTDYRVKERLSIDEIISRMPQEVRRVCITGGEPMMHNLLPFIDAVHKTGRGVSIETSGTIPLSRVFPSMTSHLNVWITCSPKFGVLDEMIKRADEIKLLVDQNFDVNKIPYLVKQHQKVFIQPINLEKVLNYDNVKHCLEVQRQFPNWRISIQLHKVLNVR